MSLRLWLSRDVFAIFYTLFVRSELFPKMVKPRNKAYTCVCPFRRFSATQLLTAFNQPGWKSDSLSSVFFKNALASQSNRLVAIVKLISIYFMALSGSPRCPDVRRCLRSCDKFDKWRGGPRLLWERRVKQVFAFHWLNGRSALHLAKR